MDEQRLNEIEKEIGSWNDMNWNTELVYELIEEVRELNEENTQLKDAYTSLFSQNQFLKTTIAKINPAGFEGESK